MRKFVYMQFIDQPPGKLGINICLVFQVKDAALTWYSLYNVVHVKLNKTGFDNEISKLLTKPVDDSKAANYFILFALIGVLKHNPDEDSKFLNFFFILLYCKKIDWILYWCQFCYPKLTKISLNTNIPIIFIVKSKLA